VIQSGPAKPAGRVRLPRRGDLVNVLEFEEPAKLTLSAPAYATVAGGDRAGFDRITFRPRMMVPTLDLDMSVEIFGERHFTPIIVGPVADQHRYHADGELATVRGASAARAAVVVSSRSSVPIADLAAQAKTPLWISVYADADARKQIDQAMAAGCKAVCIASEPAARPNWKRIETIRRGLDPPIIVKGVMTTQDAKTALDQGVKGIVVSDHGGADEDKTTPIDVLGSIVDTVAGKAVVLVDGGFRRGSDIAKALALGAHGVLLARPVMWGLAAYGADGVQGVLEMLHGDVARNMGALGAPNLASLTRATIRVHRR
jgi:4-hydroxymandelate oxidase